MIKKHNVALQDYRNSTTKKKLFFLIFDSEGQMTNVLGIGKWEIIFQVEITNAGRVFESNRPRYQHNSLEAPLG